MTLKHSLSNFPTTAAYSRDKLTFAHRYIDEILAWKKGLEEDLQQPDGIFGQIQDRIQFMLDHSEVASKAWYLDELKGLFTFVELKQKEILGASEK